MSEQPSASSSAGTIAGLFSEGPVPNQNYPQEELARKKDSIKVTGKIEVPGYEKGTLQIDVYPPVEHFEGQTPFTTAQFKAPGPYTLLLPAGTRKVQFVAWLDFTSNGPDATDANLEYPGTIDIRTRQTGIDFKIDKTHVKVAPPKPQDASQVNGLGIGSRLGPAPERPPWETMGTGTGAGTGGGKSGPAPAGVPVPAPPGAAGGPLEEGGAAPAPGASRAGAGGSPTGAPAGALAGGANDILKAAQIDRPAPKPAAAPPATSKSTGPQAASAPAAAPPSAAAAPKPAGSR